MCRPNVLLFFFILFMITTAVRSILLFRIFVLFRLFLSVFFRLRLCVLENTRCCDPIIRCTIWLLLLLLFLFLCTFDLLKVARGMGHLIFRSMLSLSAEVRQRLHLNIHHHQSVIISPTSCFCSKISRASRLLSSQIARMNRIQECFCD